MIDEVKPDAPATENTIVGLDFGEPSKPPADEPAPEPAMVEEPKADKPAPRPRTVLLDGAAHVRIEPTSHEAEGGHYGWQMSVTDKAMLDKARAADGHLSDLHTGEPVAFEDGEGGSLMFEGLPVSVFVG